MRGRWDWWEPNPFLKCSPFLFARNFLLPLPWRETAAASVAIATCGCLGPQACGALKVFFTVPLTPQSWGLLSPKLRPGKSG